MDTTPLETFFVIFAIGLTVMLAALGTALVVAQRRFRGLHRTYGQRLLDVQEEERAWVAREVHDDAVQRLAALRHEVSLCLAAVTDLPESQRRRMQGLEEEIMDLSVALRQLAHRLHPATLDHGGLQAGLEQLAGEAAELHGLRIALDIAMDDALPGPVALALYRIAQEAIRNTALHARVGQATVRVSRRDRQVEMVIEDHGRGFDAESRSTEGMDATGLGLLTMDERARQLGGTLSVTSSPGRGTRIVASLPLTEPA